MIAELLLIPLLIVAIIALVVRFTILYHFKKFSLPKDPMVKKIREIYDWGNIIIFFLSLVFLAFVLFL